MPFSITDRVLIVGAGFSGAVIARELAENGFRSLVVDHRDHIAGNCHTSRGSEGVIEHVYGPHILNTNHSDVLHYLKRWGRWIPFVNRVKAVNRRGVFSFPVNLHTINQLFGEQFNPEQAKAFLRQKVISSSEPSCFEELALSLVGRELYETFFLGYTLKQWGIHPRDLPSSIFKRLPIRFDYNDNYYNTRFQYLPEDGYSAIVSGILNHPLIETKLGQRFEYDMQLEFAHVFYSGSIDEFFSHQLGRLRYRTLQFERRVEKGDSLGNGVLNHTDDQYLFTREYEHAHFSPHESHRTSIVYREYSRDADIGDIPFYPMRLVHDQVRYNDYVALAQRKCGITFVGRLGTYRYMDMDQVIGSALDTSRVWLDAKANGAPLPLFAVFRDK